MRKELVKNHALLTVNETGEIIALQVLIGRRWRNPVRLDMALCWEWEIEKREQPCGCTMWRLGWLGFCWGRH